MNAQEAENFVKAESHIARMATIPQKLKRSIELAEREKDPEQHELDDDGIGARIQAAYTGLEALLESSLTCQGLAVPTGESSHKELIELAEKHSLVTSEEKTKLDAIRGFRHLHRHAYDLMLDREILKARALGLVEILPIITERIQVSVANAKKNQSEAPPGNLG